MDKVNEIMTAVTEYIYDMEEYSEMLDDLEIEGYEEEYTGANEVVRFLLNKKLEKRIGEILEAYEKKCDEENKAVYRVSGIMIDK